MDEKRRYNEAAPSEPVGNPLLSNMGPAAYANRADIPDLTREGFARIVPLRAAPGFFINPRDPDPRGMTVFGGDGVAAGTVSEVWVDRAEPSARYYEVMVTGLADTVLLPSTCVRFKASQREMHVKSIFARQFADVPRVARPDRVTRLEEDRIQAYYAGGYLYAEPSRQEPIL